MTRQRGLDGGPAVASVGSQQTLAHSFGHEALELDRGLAGREFDEHPRHGAHPKLAACAHVVGMRLLAGAVNNQGRVRPASTPGQRELDLTEVHDPETVDGSGSPMAEKRTRADAQNSSHEEGLGGQTRMADRVDVVVNAMEPPDTKPPVDPPVAEPELVQLVPRDHTALPGSDPSQLQLTWMTILVTIANIVIRVRHEAHGGRRNPRSWANCDEELRYSAAPPASPGRGRGRGPSGRARSAGVPVTEGISGGTGASEPKTASSDWPSSSDSN